MWNEMRNMNEVSEKWVKWSEMKWVHRVKSEWNAPATHMQQTVGEKKAKPNEQKT